MRLTFEKFRRVFLTEVGVRDDSLAERLEKFRRVFLTEVGVRGNSMLDAGGRVGSFVKGGEIVGPAVFGTRRTGESWSELVSSDS